MTMSQSNVTTDLFVELGDGVRMRVQFTALESPNAEYFDEENAIARGPDYPEVIKAAALIQAGQGERFTERAKA